MTVPKVTSTGVISTTLLVGLSLYWAVSTFTGIEESFSTPDLIAFCGMGALAVLIQILIILIVDWWRERPILTYAVTGLFVVLNAFSFNLVFSGNFLLLGTPLIVLILAAGWFVATVIVRMSDENPRLRPFVFAAIAALIASPFILMAMRSDARTAGAENSEFTASPHVRKVAFKTKPNVYFIGFDAAAPAAVVKEYFGLSPAPLPVALKEGGFHVLKNLFAETIATSTSWKIFLSMHKSYFDTLPPFNGGLMQGMNPSPLIQIFKHNGYEVSTIYKNSYFGSKKGPYVDHYEFNRTFSVCDFMEPNERRLAFYGACFMRETDAFPRGAVVQGKDIDHFLHHLKRSLKKKRPQAVIVHLHPPAHTDQKSFRYVPDQIKAFKTKYNRWSHQAAANLRLLKGMIEQSDPNAIIFVFGDHGIHLSSGARKPDLRFFVQDKFGVLGGIYPPNFCASEIEEAYKRKGFLTTTWVARLIVQCLAGGKDPFVDPDYDHVIFTKDRSYRAEDHLYE